MHRTSRYKIVADLSRSHGAYVYDLSRGCEVLDLFGLYSSLPLGYRHPAFDTEEFLDEIMAHVGVKVSLCEMSTPAALKFLRAFRAASPAFEHFHFCTTGALAVEAAVKAAIDHVGSGRGSKVITFRSSFHGIYGYGGSLSALDGPAAARLVGFPRVPIGIVLDDPRDGAEDRVLEQLHRTLAQEPVAAVLVEPMQCTAGDRLLSGDVLRKIRAICSDAARPLIFDEIQVGFGATGTLWYHEQMGVTPDIVVFGKRSQVSGFMALEPFGAIFRCPERLEATWDGDILDMILCRAILSEYRSSAILANVVEQGMTLRAGLTAGGLDARGVGLTLALDFEDARARNDVMTALWKGERTTVIPTGARTVRLRPPLSLDAQTGTEAVDRIVRAAASVNRLTGARA